jgi:hypothetical protein
MAISMHWHMEVWVVEELEQVEVVEMVLGVEMEVA